MYIHTVYTCIHTIYRLYISITSIKDTALCMNMSHTAKMRKYFVAKVSDNKCNNNSFLSVDSLISGRNDKTAIIIHPMYSRAYSSTTTAEQTCMHTYAHQA